MFFNYDFSDELEHILKKIYKKDKKRYFAILKKIEEIVSRDVSTIDFYKNLKHDLKNYKRVHVMGSFVLLFKVYKDKNYILFDKFGYHDNIYKI
jgi:YafQ family addiction module toxin component